MTQQHAENAASPADISLRGWGEVALAAGWSWMKHRSPAAGAGAAFYLLLAFFPGVAAMGSFLGLIQRPHAVEKKLQFIASLVPEEVYKVIVGEAPRFAAADPAKLLGATLLFAGLAVLSASSAVRQLMVALNVVYRREETRRWLRKRIIATAFATACVLAIGVEVALLARTRHFDTAREGWGEALELGWKWVSMLAVSVVFLTLLYRYAPDRERPARWRWVTPGSLFAAACGIATSVGASIYLSHVARYEHVYGDLGVLLGLAVWLWAGMMVVLAGAELNFAIECQTSADTCGADETVPR
jgi:membrane protein